MYRMPLRTPSGASNLIPGTSKMASGDPSEASPDPPESLLREVHETDCPHNRDFGGTPLAKTTLFMFFWTPNRWFNHKFLDPGAGWE